MTCMGFCAIIKLNVIKYAFNICNIFITDAFMLQSDN